MTGTIYPQKLRSNESPFESVDDAFGAQVRDHALTLIEGMTAQVPRTISRAKANPKWAEAGRDSVRIELVIAAIQDDANAILRSEGHSTHYQHLLVRRLIPIMARNIGFDWFGPDSRYLRSSDFLIEVIRCATRLVFSSGTALEAGETPREWVTTKTGEGLDYGFADYRNILACARVVALAMLWHDCEVKFRYASKERVIFDQDGVPVDLARTDDVAGYEKRRDRYQTIAGTAGFWIDRDRFPSLRSRLCGWFSLIGPSDARHAFSCSLGDESFSSSFVCIPLIDAGERGSSTHEHKTSEPGDLRLLPYDRLIRKTASGTGRCWEAWTRKR